MPFTTLAEYNKFFAVLTSDLIAVGGINTEGYSGNLPRKILEILESNICHSDKMARLLNVDKTELQRDYELYIKPIFESLSKSDDSRIALATSISAAATHAEQLARISGLARTLAEDAISALESGKPFALSGGWSGQGSIMGHRMNYIFQPGPGGDLLHITVNTGSGISYHPKKPGIDEHGRNGEYYPLMGHSVENFMNSGDRDSRIRKLSDFINGLIEPMFSPYYKEGHSRVMEAPILYSDRIGRINALGRVSPVDPTAICITPSSTPGQRSGSCVGRVLVKVLQCFAPEPLNIKIIYGLKYLAILEQKSALERLASAAATTHSDLITAAKLLKFAVQDLCRREVELKPIPDAIFATQHSPELEDIIAFTNTILASSPTSITMPTAMDIRDLVLSHSADTTLHLAPAPITGGAGRVKLIEPSTAVVADADIGMDTRPQFPVDLSVIDGEVNVPAMINRTLIEAKQFYDLGDNKAVLEIIENTMLRPEIVDSTAYPIERGFHMPQIGMGILKLFELLRIYIANCGPDIDGTKAMTLLSFIMATCNFDNNGQFGNEFRVDGGVKTRDSILHLFASPFFLKFFDGLKTSPVLASSSAKASMFLEHVINYFEAPLPLHGDRSRRQKLMAEGQNSSTYALCKQKYRFKTIVDALEHQYPTTFARLTRFTNSLSMHEKCTYGQYGNSTQEQNLQVVMDNGFATRFIAANHVDEDIIIEARYNILYEILLQKTLVSCIDVMRDGLTMTRDRLGRFPALATSFHGDMEPAEIAPLNTLIMHATSSTGSAIARNGIEWLRYTIHYHDGSVGSIVQASVLNCPARSYATTPDKFLPSTEIRPVSIFSCRSSNLQHLQALSWHLIADCTYGQESRDLPGASAMLQAHLEEHPEAGSAYTANQAQLIKFSSFRDAYYESNRHAIEIMKRLRSMSSHNSIIAKAISLRSHPRLQIESTLDFIAMNQELIGGASLSSEEKFLWRNMCLYNIFQAGLLVNIVNRQLDDTDETSGRAITDQIRDICTSGMIQFSPKNIATETALFYIQLAYTSYQQMLDFTQYKIAKARPADKDALAAKCTAYLSPFRAIFEDRLDALIESTKNYGVLANLHMFRKMYLHKKLISLPADAGEQTVNEIHAKLLESTIISNIFPKEIDSDDMPILQEDNTFHREHMAVISSKQGLVIRVIQEVIAKYIPTVQAIVDANITGSWRKSVIHGMDDRFHFDFGIDHADAPRSTILARISIESGKILIGAGTVIGPVPLKYRKHPTYRKVLGELNTTCSMRSDESTILINDNGNKFLLALAAPTADLKIQRSFPINGTNNYYQLVSLGCKRIGLPNLVLGAELPRVIREKYNQGWISLDGDTEQLIIVDSAASEPKPKYRYDYASAELHMLDEASNDSGYVLAALTNPAYASVSMFEDPQLVLVWQLKAAVLDHDATGKFGQVYIQIPRYNIGFIGNPSAVPSDHGFAFELESDRTYKLKQDGLEEVIPGFPHSLCLELKNRGTRKIIIPRSQFYIDFSDTKSDMYHGRVYDTGIHNMHARLKQISGNVPDSESDLFPPQYSHKGGQITNFIHYSYQLNELGELVSTSPQAVLQLVYILITKGLYSHAIKSLRSCPTLEGNPREAEVIYWILSALTYKPFESDLEPDYIKWEKAQANTPEIAAIRLLLCNKILEEIFYAHSSFKVEDLTATLDATDPMLSCNQYLASRLNNLFSIDNFNKILAKFARQYAFDSSRLSADVKLIPSEIEKVSTWLFEHGYNTGIYAALYKTVVLNSAVAQLNRLYARKHQQPRRVTRYEDMEVARLEALIRSEEELKIAGPTIVEIEDKELSINFPITRVNKQDFFMALYNRQTRTSSTVTDLGLSLDDYIARFGNNFEKIEFYFKDLFDHIITAGPDDATLSKLEESLANNIRASHMFSSSEEFVSRETEEERITKQARNELVKILYLLISDKKRGALTISREHFGFITGRGLPSNENGRTNFAELLERLKDHTFHIDIPVQKNEIISARTALRDHPTLSIVSRDLFAPTIEHFKPLSYADIDALRPDKRLQLADMSREVGLEKMMEEFGRRIAIGKRVSKDSSLPESASFLERMDAHITTEIELGCAMVDSDIAFRDAVISHFLAYFNTHDFDLVSGDNFLESRLERDFIVPLEDICIDSKHNIERLFFKVGDSGEHKAFGVASLRHQVDFSQVLMLSIFGSPEVYHRFNSSLTATDIEAIYKETFRYIQAALLKQRYKRSASEVNSLARRILEIKETQESLAGAATPEITALSDIDWGKDYTCRSLATRICSQLFSPDHSSELLKLLESPDDSIFSAVQEGRAQLELDPSMFAALSYFQYVRSVLLRDEQISYLLHMRRFIESPETRGMIINSVYQMIMGFGKSKVVSPMDIVFSLMSNPGGLVVVEVPESLIHTFFQDTDAQTRHFGHRAKLLRVNRDSINTPSDLRMILNTIEGAKARGDYIITEGNGIPALYLMMQTVTLEKPSVSIDSEEYREWSEKVILANRIMNIISHPSAVLMDEVDSLINPLSKFIFSFTPPKPIDPNRAKWNTKMMLSLEHVDISDIIIPPQPAGTFNFLDVIRRKHPERRAEDKLIHTEEQWRAVMVKIATFLVSDPESPLQVALLVGKEGPIIDYLLDKQDKPGFFATLPDSMQQQIDLYYAYINKLLHFTVIEKGNYLVENGPIDPDSPDPVKRMISKPYKGSNAPDTSDWGNPDVLMIFSLFNLIILGLRNSDIKNMISSLQFVALEEMRQHAERRPEDTQPAIHFAEMYAKLKSQIDSQRATGTPEIITAELISDVVSDGITIHSMLDHLSALKLHDIDPEKPEFIVLCKLLSKNREFNEYFFTNPHGIAKHIYTMTETLECTAAQHLMCYGNRNIRGMSGDPWTASSFPASFDRANETVGMGTTGRILRYMQEANITTTCVETDPYAVLQQQIEEVRARTPSDVSSVKALIDLEAKFKGQSNQYCASRFADYFADHRDEHPTIKYVIFLKSFRDEFGFINQKLYALNIDSREEVKLDTSDYEVIRRVLGVDCDSYFVYFSQFGGTRGLDVKLAPGSIFTLLIDGDAKLFEIEQAALRARELSIFGQKLIISVDPDFKSKVMEVDSSFRTDDDLTFRQIVQVAHRNQVETLEPLNITGCIDMLHAIVTYYCNLLKDGQDPEHQHIIATTFKDFIASTTPSHLSKLYGIRPKEKESQVIFVELKDEIIRRFTHLARDLHREVLDQTIKSSDLEMFGVDAATPITIEEAIGRAIENMNSWMLREIEQFVLRCPKTYKLTGNSGADSQVTIQHQVKTKTRVATYLQDLDPRAKALPHSAWISSLGVGPGLYDLRDSIAAGNIVPLEDIFQYSAIGEKGWSFDPHMKASEGFMLTTTAHRDGRSSRLDAYSKQVEYILFSNSGELNILDCILLSKSEADTLLQRMLSTSASPIPIHKNFWIERISGIRVAGRGPREEDLKITNYYTLQEQARLIGGHVGLLSRQSAPLVWLTKDSTLKLKFLTEIILPKHDVEPSDLENLQRRVSALSKYFNMVFEADDFTPMRDVAYWAQFPDDIEEDDREVLAKMATLFSAISIIDDLTAQELDDRFDWSAPPNSYPATAVIVIQEFVRKRVRDINLLSIFSRPEAFSFRRIMSMVQEINRQNPELTLKVLNEDKFSGCRGLLEFAGKSLKNNPECIKTITFLIKEGGEPKLPTLSGDCSVMHSILSSLSPEVKSTLFATPIEMLSAFSGGTKRFIALLNGLLARDLSGCSALSILTNSDIAEHEEPINKFLSSLLEYCSKSDELVPYLARIIEDQHRHIHELDITGSPILNAIKSLAFDKWSPELLANIITNKPQIAHLKSDVSGNTVLHQALLKNDHNLIKVILALSPDIIFQANNDGQTIINIMEAPSADTGVSGATKELVRGFLAKLQALSEMVNSDDKNDAAIIEFLSESPGLINAQISLLGDGVADVPPTSLILALLQKGKILAAQSLVTTYSGKVKLDCVDPVMNFSILHLLSAIVRALSKGGAAASIDGSIALSEEDERLSSFISKIDLLELINKFAYHEDNQGATPLSLMLDSGVDYSSFSYSSLLTEIIKFDLEHEQKANYSKILLEIYPQTFKPNPIAELILANLDVKSAENMECLRAFFHNIISKDPEEAFRLLPILLNKVSLLLEEGEIDLADHRRNTEHIRELLDFLREQVVPYYMSSPDSQVKLLRFLDLENELKQNNLKSILCDSAIEVAMINQKDCSIFLESTLGEISAMVRSSTPVNKIHTKSFDGLIIALEKINRTAIDIVNRLVLRETSSSLEEAEGFFDKKPDLAEIIRAFSFGYASFCARRKQLPHSREIAIDLLPCILLEEAFTMQIIEDAKSHKEHGFLSLPLAFHSVDPVVTANLSAITLRVALTKLSDPHLEAPIFAESSDLISVFHPLIKMLEYCAFIKSYTDSIYLIDLAFKTGNTELIRALIPQEIRATGDIVKFLTTPIFVEIADSVSLSRSTSDYTADCIVKASVPRASRMQREKACMVIQNLGLLPIVPSTSYSSAIGGTRIDIVDRDPKFFISEDSVIRSIDAITSSSVDAGDDEQSHFLHHSTRFIASFARHIICQDGLTTLNINPTSTNYIPIIRKILSFIEFAAANNLLNTFLSVFLKNSVTGEIELNKYASFPKYALYEKDITSAAYEVITSCCLVHLARNIGAVLREGLPRDECFKESLKLFTSILDNSSNFAFYNNPSLFADDAKDLVSSSYPRDALNIVSTIIIENQDVPDIIDITLSSLKKNLKGTVITHELLTHSGAREIIIEDSLVLFTRSLICILKQVSIAAKSAPWLVLKVMASLSDSSCKISAPIIEVCGQTGDIDDTGINFFDLFSEGFFQAPDHRDMQILTASLLRYNPGETAATFFSNFCDRLFSSLKRSEQPLPLERISIELSKFLKFFLFNMETLSSSTYRSIHLSEEEIVRFYQHLDVEATIKPMLNFILQQLGIEELTNIITYLSQSNIISNVLMARPCKLTLSPGTRTTLFREVVDLLTMEAEPSRLTLPCVERALLDLFASNRDTLRGIDPYGSAIYALCERGAFHPQLIRLMSETSMFGLKIELNTVMKIISGHLAVAEGGSDPLADIRRRYCSEFLLGSLRFPEAYTLTGGTKTTKQLELQLSEGDATLTLFHEANKALSSGHISDDDSKEVLSVILSHFVFQHLVSGSADKLDLLASVCINLENPDIIKILLGCHTGQHNILHFLLERRVFDQKNIAKLIQALPELLITENETHIQPIAILNDVFPSGLVAINAAVLRANIIPMDITHQFIINNYREIVDDFDELIVPYLTLNPAREEEHRALVYLDILLSKLSASNKVEEIIRILSAIPKQLFPNKDILSSTFSKLAHLTVPLGSIEQVLCDAISRILVEPIPTSIETICDVVKSSLLDPVAAEESNQNAVNLNFLLLSILMNCRGEDLIENKLHIVSAILMSLKFIIKNHPDDIARYVKGLCSTSIGSELIPEAISLQSLSSHSASGDDERDPAVFCLIADHESRRDISFAESSLKHFLLAAVEANKISIIRPFSNIPDTRAFYSSRFARDMLCDMIDISPVDVFADDMSIVFIKKLISRASTANANYVVTKILESRNTRNREIVLRHIFNILIEDVPVTSYLEKIKIRTIVNTVLKSSKRLHSTRYFEGIINKYLRIYTSDLVPDNVDETVCEAINILAENESFDFFILFNSSSMYGIELIRFLSSNHSISKGTDVGALDTSMVRIFEYMLKRAESVEDFQTLISTLAAIKPSEVLAKVLTDSKALGIFSGRYSCLLHALTESTIPASLLKGFIIGVIEPQNIYEFKCFPHILSKLGERTPAGICEQGIRYLRDMLRNTRMRSITTEDLESFTILINTHPDFIKSVNVKALPQTDFYCPEPIYRTIITNNPRIILDLQNYGILSSIISYLLDDINSSNTPAELELYYNILEQYAKPAIEEMLAHGKSLSEVSYGLPTNASEIESGAIELLAAINDVCVETVRAKRLSLTA